jgi:hypothetical protein
MVAAVAQWAERNYLRFWVELKDVGKFKVGSSSDLDKVRGEIQTAYGKAEQYLQHGKFECRMETNPEDDKQPEPYCYPRKIDDTYTFDASTGIYKPKTVETGQETARQKAGTNRHARLFTDPKTDWRPIIITVTVSLLTVGLLVATVHYARLQWQEMKPMPRTIPLSQLKTPLRWHIANFNKMPVLIFG